MNKKESTIILILFLHVFIFMIVVNYLKSSEWILDNSLSAVFIFAIFLLRKWIYISKTSFIMLGFALVIHDLGMFGFYEMENSIVGYDNIVHFISSFVTAYILFSFIAKKLHIKKNKVVKRTVVDEHVLTLVFLVVSSAVMLGTIIELVEFVGYSFLGVGDGLFFFGSGDSGGFPYYAGEYVDVMTDILVNIMGTFLGVIVYYNFRYKNKSWL